jgi:hypothetical protein
VVSAVLDDAALRLDVGRRLSLSASVARFPSCLSSRASRNAAGSAVACERLGMLVMGVVLLPPLSRCSLGPVGGVAVRGAAAALRERFREHDLSSGSQRAAVTISVITPWRFPGTSRVGSAAGRAGGHNCSMACSACLQGFRPGEHTRKERHDPLVHWDRYFLPVL